MEKFSSLGAFFMVILSPLHFAVYHSVHKASRRPVAVKLIRLENPDSDTQSQIISELHSLHQCHSTFIIAFYGAFFR